MGDAIAFRYWLSTTSCEAYEFQIAVYTLERGMPVSCEISQT